MQARAKVSLLILIACALLAGCSTEDVSPTYTPQSPAETTSPPATEAAFDPVQEITFRSGPFRLVGELQLPGESQGYPTVVMVHGDGPLDRDCYGIYRPLMDRYLRAGYAVFSWDKPGVGASTGIRVPG